MTKHFFAKNSKRRPYLKLAHLMSPDDYGPGEIPGSDKVKALTRKSQEESMPGQEKDKFPSSKR